MTILVTIVYNPCTVEKLLTNSPNMVMVQKVSITIKDVSIAVKGLGTLHLASKKNKVDKTKPANVKEYLLLLPPNKKPIEARKKADAT